MLRDSTHLMSSRMSWILRAGEEAERERVMEREVEGMERDGTTEREDVE